MWDVLRRIDMKLLVFFLVTALRLPVDDLRLGSFRLDPCSYNATFLVLKETLLGERAYRLETAGHGVSAGLGDVLGGLRRCVETALGG